MGKDTFTLREKAKWRAKGYSLRSCWKCGRQWFSLTENKGTWLPAKKVYRHVCRKCKEQMSV